MSDWLVQESHGSAQEFHHRPFPQDGHHPDGPTASKGGTLTATFRPADQFRPTVWIHRVEKPALVLGSTQDESILRAEKAKAAGYEISTRRSGGGLVLVSPSTSCWIDVLLPANHIKWEADISRAFHWVGDLWAETLRELGVSGCQVHRGPLMNREHGRLLCFAGLGPGEVTLDGYKIVGLSQRRVRAGARFQGLLVGAWDHHPLRQFLQPSALPDGMDFKQILVGHPSLTPAIIDAVPNTFVSLLAGQ